jgi:hypothetical protein
MSRRPKAHPPLRAAQSPPPASAGRVSNRSHPPLAPRHLPMAPQDLGAAHAGTPNQARRTGGRAHADTSPPASAAPTLAPLQPLPTSGARSPGVSTRGRERASRRSSATASGRYRRCRGQACDRPHPRDTWRAMSRENVECVRRLPRAFNDGDVEALVAECDLGVEWEEQSIPGVDLIFRGMNGVTAATSTPDSGVSPLPCVATRRSPLPPASNSRLEPSRRRTPPTSCGWGR